MVVREPNGVLRKVDYNERTNLMKIFYPKQSGLPDIPKFLSDMEYFEIQLKNEKYTNVLDAAAYFFGTDDERFCSIAEKVYSHINSQKYFGKIDCSRHFGSMIFYLLNQGDFNNFVEYFASQNDK